MDTGDGRPSVCTYKLGDGDSCLERVYETTPAGPRCLAHLHADSAADCQAVDVKDGDGKTLVRIEVKRGPKGAPLLSLRPVAKD